MCVSLPGAVSCVCVCVCVSVCYFQVQAAAHASKHRAWNFLCACASTSCLTNATLCVCLLCTGAGSSTRLKAQGMEFSVWVCKHAAQHQLKAMAPAVLQVRYFLCCLLPCALVGLCGNVFTCCLLLVALARVLFFVLFVAMCTCLFMGNFHKSLVWHPASAEGHGASRAAFLCADYLCFMRHSCPFVSWCFPLLCPIAFAILRSLTL